jgi:hypothetical protein
MMMHGRNNGKKLMTVRILKHSFEIIHLLTGEVMFYDTDKYTGYAFASHQLKFN